MFSRETSLATWAVIGLLLLSIPYLVSRDTATGHQRLNARDIVSHRTFGEGIDD